ncbi:hypothetical protein ABZ912_59535 [Nonomuraea angiospora]|uniref:hypothetical protein n=1 Tax=Nonomuraea angiospora TaxID=46172 RepID=UPI0033C95179
MTDEGRHAQDGEADSAGPAAALIKGDVMALMIACHRDRCPSGKSSSQLMVEIAGRHMADPGTGDMRSHRERTLRQTWPAVPGPRPGVSTVRALAAEIAAPDGHGR